MIVRTSESGRNVTYTTRLKPLTNQEKGKTMEKYKIVRHYYDPWRRSRTIESGLTLEQVQAHCGDPETSSSTCVTAKRKAYTRKVGEWFDGYTAE